MQDKVLAMLCDLCGANEGELEPDMDLFEMGLLDSFGVVELLVALETQFGVVIDIETLTRADIATPAKIMQRIAGDNV